MTRPIRVAAELDPVDADSCAAVLDVCAARVVDVADVPLDKERKTLGEGCIEGREVPFELNAVGPGATHQELLASRP